MSLNMRYTFAVLAFLLLGQLLLVSACMRGKELEAAPPTTTTTVGSGAAAQQSARQLLGRGGKAGRGGSAGGGTKGGSRSSRRGLLTADSSVMDPGAASLTTFNTADDGSQSTTPGGQVVDRGAARLLPRGRGKIGHGGRGLLDGVVKTSALAGTLSTAGGDAMSDSSRGQQTRLLLGRGHNGKGSTSGHRPAGGGLRGLRGYLAPLLSLMTTTSPAGLTAVAAGDSPPRQADNPRGLARLLGRVGRCGCTGGRTGSRPSGSRAGAAGNAGAGAGSSAGAAGSAGAGAGSSAGGAGSAGAGAGSSASAAGRTGARAGSGSGDDGVLAGQTASMSQRVREAVAAAESAVAARGAILAGAGAGP